MSGTAWQRMCMTPSTMLAFDTSTCQQTCWPRQYALVGFHTHSAAMIGSQMRRDRAHMQGLCLCTVQPTTWLIATTRRWLTAPKASAPSRLQGLWWWKCSNGCTARQRCQQAHPLITTATDQPPLSAAGCAVPAAARPSYPQQLQVKSAQ